MLSTPFCSYRFLAMTGPIPGILQRLSSALIRGSSSRRSRPTKIVYTLLVQMEQNISVPISLYNRTHVLLHENVDTYSPAFLFQVFLESSELFFFQPQEVAWPPTQI